MATCVGCGSSEGRMFAVRTYEGVTLTFDSVECALPFIAPTCDECFCQILGHALIVGDQIYCGPTCARVGSKRNDQSHVRGLK